MERKLIQFGVCLIVVNANHRQTKKLKFYYPVNDIKFEGSFYILCWDQLN